MSDGNTEDKQEKENGKTSRNVKLYNPLELFAYILVGVTTVSSAIASISHEFYKSLAGRKVYRQFWVDRDEATRRLYDTAKSTKELVQGKKLIEKTFDKAVDKELAQHGIPLVTGPISYVKRTWAQFLTLKSFEKRNVVVKLGMIASVAVVATWFLSRETKKTQDTARKNNTKPDVTKRTANSAEQPSDKRDEDSKTHTPDAIKDASSDKPGFNLTIDNAKSATDSAERQMS